MFDVGLSELAVIAFIAVFVFGPDRLPDLARQAGRFLRQVRAMANSARDDLRKELGPDYADLELRDLDPRTIVRKHVLEAMDDDEDDDRADRDGAGGRHGRRPLDEGERPPYDAEAT
ncbi:sec-independent translocase [Nocardioides donggukensis]|uniref:Twin-arginine translocase subunit TatB n=1 Tax=Nocardioides donggukensis TaxID=2774019 RepID=A0A927K4V7_9ACTN|nr:sec-independent translocase [Nocardioides donggukensis]MBD8870262.1 twin-arginine translocase subunit TatB [Nocardioides donggukensis]